MSSSEKVALQSLSGPKNPSGPAFCPVIVPAKSAAARTSLRKLEPESSLIDLADKILLSRNREFSRFRILARLAKPAMKSHRRVRSTKGNKNSSVT